MSDRMGNVHTWEADMTYPNYMTAMDAVVVLSWEGGFEQLVRRAPSKRKLAGERCDGYVIVLP